MKQRLLFFLLEGKDAVWMIWKDMVDKNEMASPYVNEMAQNIEGEDWKCVCQGRMYFWEKSEATLLDGLDHPER